MGKSWNEKGDVRLMGLLRECARRADVSEGNSLHDHILKTGLLESNPYIGSSLINMYAKCGVFAEAERVLKLLPIRDVVSWSALIAAYAQQGHGHEALNCYEKMQKEGISPNLVTFICMVKACGSIQALDKGRKIHDDVVHRGFLNRSVTLGNAFIDMYVKCGVLVKAQQVLDAMPERDVISWSTIIAGFAQNGQGHAALDCFSGMQKDGITPNEVTFLCVLKACGSLGAIRKGKEIHDVVVNRGLLEKHVSIGNALIDMYVKCGDLERARQIIEDLFSRNVVSWNALIAGYAHHEQGHEALNCFEQMQREGLSPNEVTFACIIKACASAGFVDKGEEIHDELMSRGLLNKNVVLGTALVDMYARCGLLDKAKQLLLELPVRNLVSWSALIASYAQHDHGHEALQCFTEMQREGLNPDAVTFASILKACGSVGAFHKGKEIHYKISQEGLLEKNIFLGTALVDMYAKCGVLEKAQQVLKELPRRDIISWNTIIAGYAQNGNCNEVLTCFEQMKSDGHSPDERTFLCVLTACSRSGSTDKAQTYFESMSSNYGMTPNYEHHTCMLMAFGCAGHFEKALSVVKAMLSVNQHSVWLTLLCICRKLGNMKLGGLAFDHTLQFSNNLASDRGRYLRSG